MKKYDRINIWMHRGGFEAKLCVGFLMLAMLTR